MNHSMTWADFYLICFAVGFFRLFWAARADTFISRTRMGLRADRIFTPGTARPATRPVEMQPASAWKAGTFRRSILPPWRHFWRGLAERVIC